MAATLFSGIGAPETAMPHWDWRWCAEIEKFPCAVLAERHPRSQNLGDVSANGFAKKAAEICRPDVLVFGSPCQSFSVAGKRLGLDDPRGNLALVALGIIGQLRPSWFVFENVPGLLSLDDGSAFGLFLRTVDELRYSLAWTVLDAQYFGVAQRRARVFAVGYLGDWRYPAAVLFEPQSLRGHSAPRRKAGQTVAPTIASRPTGGGGLGTDFDCDGGLIAGTLGTRSAAHPSGAKHEADFMIAGTLSAARGKASARDASQETYISMSLNARIDCESETFVTHALRADGFDASEDGTGRATPIIFSSKDHGADAGELAPTLRAGAFNKSHANGGVPPAVASLGSAVRRLTPRECERLQGFPDDYNRGKLAADGPRYKALGNSMAVPVMRWILNRIEQIQSQRGAGLARHDAAASAS